MSNTNFPANLDTFTNPTGSESENSSPPHHLQHGIENDSILALETKVGIDGSAVENTLDFLTKNATNPGHTHTNAITVDNVTLSGSDEPTGPGMWTDTTNLFLNNAGAAGGIVLRPNGPSSVNYQFQITSGGIIASSNSSGGLVNTFDDGSGNMKVAGNTIIDGNLSVGGSFSSAMFDYGNPSNSAVNDTASQGIQTSLSRSDHVHGREQFSAILPLVASLTPTAGTSPHPARSDHIHPAQATPAPTGLPAGIAGATAYTRFAGGTISGPPTTGSFSQGDFVIDESGGIWVCTITGAPGTWVTPKVLNNPAGSMTNTGSPLTYTTNSWQPVGNMAINWLEGGVTFNEAEACLFVPVPGIYNISGSISQANGLSNIIYGVACGVGGTKIALSTVQTAPIDTVLGINIGFSTDIDISPGQAVQLLAINTAGPIPIFSAIETGLCLHLVSRSS